MAVLPCIAPIDPSGILAACNRMDGELIKWGRIILAGGNGPSLKYGESDQEAEHFGYTASDYDAAYLLHLAVGRLPQMRQRFVLATFYRQKSAADWGNMSQRRRDEIAADLVLIINGKIKGVERTIAAADLDPIRLRAIRVLVNNAALLP